MNSSRSISNVSKWAFSFLNRTKCVLCKVNPTEEWHRFFALSRLHSQSVHHHHCQCRYQQRFSCKQGILRKRGMLLTFQLTNMLSSETKKIPSLTFHDTACIQGVQGDVDGDDQTYKLWLESCRRYGLSNCDEQLQGIQEGRRTVRDVVAEQSRLIEEIAEEYRLKNLKRREASIQGMQELEMLPQLDAPCPQGIQGEDCARYKMWLENCHLFKFSDCPEQWNNYLKGRKTLAQIFDEQDKAIRRVVESTQHIQMSGPSSCEHPSTEISEKPLTSGQKLKNAVAVYGSTVIVFHVCISLMSLGFFYTLVSSGIDVAGLLSRLGIGDGLQTKLAAGTGTFVVAYAVHKVFAPARIAATLTCTPLIVRYLRRIGVLKKPPSKPSSPPPGL